MALHGRSSGDCAASASVEDEAGFYCAELRLAIELDGEVHDHPERIFRDSLRDMVLATEAEVLVVGIPNAVVSEENLRAVLQVVRDARLSLSLQGPEGRGGRGVRS